MATVIATPLRILPAPGRGKLSYLPARIEKALRRLTRGLDRGGSVRRVLRSVGRAGRRDSEGRRLVEHLPRARRAERVAHMGAVLQILLRLTDAKSGRIGRPGPTPGSWEFPTIEDIDRYAFGAQVERERSIARTRRALADLETAGYLASTERKRVTEKGIRSRAALRSVTAAFCQLVGLALRTGAAAQEQLHATKRAQSHQRREHHGADTRRDRGTQAVQVGALLTPGERPASPASKPPGTAPPEQPPGVARPAAPEVVQRHLDDIRKILDA